MSDIKFYPSKKGNIFQTKKDGQWKKKILELSKPLNEAIDKLIWQLHDRKYTIEEISYVLSVGVSNALSIYEMLGKVVEPVKKANKLRKKLMPILTIVCPK